jgi:hypothetical protein
MTDDAEPKPQKTTPKGKDDKGEPAKPIEIPGLKRKDFDASLRKAAKGKGD